MESFDRDKIEKYRQWLNDEIAACEHLLETYEMSDAEKTTEYWYKRSAFKMTLEEFDRLIPPAVYLPKWVITIPWGLFVLIILFLVALAFKFNK